MNIYVSARTDHPGPCGTARSGPLRRTGSSPMTSGRRWPARSCTAPAWPRTGRRTTWSGGSRSGTPRITSTSWPMLARQDGTRPQTWNDYYRVGEACRVAEQRFGLRRTAPRDRTAARRPTRPESEKARRRRLPETPRITLRRAVSTAAAGSASEQEFFARLDQADILVRKRFSTRNPGEVTGYAVALPHDTTRADTPVWFGGGKLAADLTLPKPRSRWQATGPQPGDRFTAAE